MKLPIMSVSGIRGVVGETLDELFVAQIAYIQALQAGGGKIIVGRDTRPSGEMLSKAAFRGIRAAGGVPIDIGIATTPTTCVCVAEKGASGGIVITASHNPIAYNGYKMVHRSGRLFRGTECELVYESFRKSEFASQDTLQKCSDEPAEKIDAGRIHIRRILTKIDRDLIASKNITIAVDSINGAAGAIFPALLEELSVKWTGVHNKLDGDFVHNPEPRPEHLTDLSSLLQQTEGLWGGFVFDPDGDRLATMGERGEAISEEMTLVFALDNLLGRSKAKIATNLSTSMLVDDVARQYGVEVVRSRIGEAHVVAAMQERGCAYGGEGNGGVIFPEVSTVRDGLAGMAIILELMARKNKRLTELAAAWPVYAIVKEKVSCEGLDPAELIEKLKLVFAAEKTDRLDGLKILRDYGWVHLRSSNTEPIIRCYAEARSEKQARELADLVLHEVHKSRLPQSGQE